MTSPTQVQLVQPPAPGKPVTAGAGPFRGVDSTVAPYDDSPDELTDALNGYFPDPLNGSEFAARPGCTTHAPPASTNGVGDIFSFQNASTTINFQILNHSGTWKLYRMSGTIMAPTLTDVSPVGITMSPPFGGNGGASVFMTQLAGTLIVSDGANRPWIGTNLSSTPITGTYIDGDGSGTSWFSVGEPQIYQGSLMFISMTTFGNVTGGISIIWSEPNQPALGYMQSGYADFWNLIQTGSTPLFALKATNSGLYYFRENSIGCLTGTPSINFQNTATHDVVSVNTGSVSSKGIKAFGNYLYFMDAVGRPWRFAIGGNPEPIWLKMRQFYEAATTASVQAFGFAVIEPNLNLYIAFPWNDGNSGCATGYVFDANTGIFEGRWQIADWGSHTSPSAMLTGNFVSDGTNNFLILLGSNDNAGSNLGTQWTLNLISAGVWSDGAGVAAMPITAQTQRLGYNARVKMAPQQIRAVTNNQTPIALTSVSTVGTISQGTQTPPASSDGTNLAVWVPDVSTQGRGFQLQLSPTTSTTQWRLFRVEADLASVSNVVSGDQ